MTKTIVVEDQEIYLSSSTPIPPCEFVGRKEELELCRSAWGVTERGKTLGSFAGMPLHFRLQGPPGVGKNEIIYEIARTLNMPLYIIQGHEELTPEDLSLLLAPDTLLSRSSSMPLVLRASPLATAIHEGGLFFFDEINRVPERTLSPLSSVLDGRQYIYSAMTALRVEPKDDNAKRRFRFCCALNPGLSMTGHVLPDYIEQRTLPVVTVDYPPFDELREILQRSLRCPDVLLDEFERWYVARSDEEISVRQALAMMAFALNNLPARRKVPRWLDDIASLFVGSDIPGRRREQS